MIEQFEGQHSWLSNFWKSPLVLYGATWPTAEHAYQGMKTADMVERDAIWSCKTPGQAKRMGQTVTLVSNWDEVKLTIMENVLDAKFEDSRMRRLLLKTGSEELQEGNYWGDDYWGVDLKTGKGENHLGILLMKVREHVRYQSISRSEQRRVDRFQFMKERRIEND